MTDKALPYLYSLDTFRTALWQLYKTRHTYSGEEKTFQRPILYPNSDEAYRKAAIMLLFYFDSIVEDTCIVFIKRASHKGDPHSGQISFPGGAMEPQDASLLECAKRETIEETGLDASMIEPITALSTFRIDSSKFEVTPVIGLYHDTPSFQPNPNEVDKVISFPFRLTIEPSRKKQGDFVLSDGSVFKGDYYDLGYGKIWGATAYALFQFNLAFLEYINIKQ